MNINEGIKEKAVTYLMDIPEILSGKKKINKHDIKECDIYRMKDIAQQQLLLPLFYKTYYEYLPISIKNNYDVASYEVNAKLKMLKIIKNEFDKNNIEFILIKGFPFSEYIYSDCVTRVFDDLDILIDSEKMEDAHRLMYKIGFTSKLENEGIPDFNTLDCYEISYDYLLTEENIISREFEYEVSAELKIMTSSIRDWKLLERFKSNKTTMLLDDIEIKTFNLNDTFILLCINTYGNFELEFAKAKMRDIFDIYFFLQRYEHQIDWDYTLEICNQFEITHKLYAIFNVINNLYKDRVPKEVMERFNLKHIPYDKNIFQNYEHGFMKDWNWDFIDIMLNDECRRREEIYYQSSLKTYSSRNKYFGKMNYIKGLQKFNGDFEESIRLPGFKSDKNELEYSYRFSHDTENVYFELNFEQFNHDNNMRTVLIIFDIDRESPRKMVEFSYNSGKIISKSLVDDFECKQIINSENCITISMNKEQFNVLKNKGKILGYRMYSVRSYGKVDFAIIDDLNTFDTDNPHLIYLNSNYKDESLQS